MELNNIIDANAERALDLLLKSYDISARKKVALAMMECGMIPKPKKLTNTRYEFKGCGRAFIKQYLVCRDVHVVEMDKSRMDSLCHYLEKKYGNDWNLFEIEEQDDCIVAFD